MANHWWSTLGGLCAGALLAGLVARQIDAAEQEVTSSALARMHTTLERMDARLRELNHSCARGTLHTTAAAIVPSPSVGTIDPVATSAGHVPTPEDGPPAPTERQIRAGDELAQHVRRAIERGRWTERDRDEFRRLASEADPSEGAALRLELVQAINAQRLDVDLTVPF